MTKHFAILNHWTSAVLFEGRFGTMRLCVEVAVQKGTSLVGAHLAGANLAYVNLDGANLAYVNLAGASLDGANLAYVNLAGASLRGASLAGANLDGANFRSARLCGVNLAGASLRGASLAGANLDGASLRGVKMRNGDTALGAPTRRATRADGYEFFLWPTDRGWRIGAGCRWFTLDEAWAHWERTRPEDTPGSLGAETRDILTMFQLHMDRVG